MPASALEGRRRARQVKASDAISHARVARKWSKLERVERAKELVHEASAKADATRDADPSLAAHSPVAELQRTVGNVAVVGLLGGMFRSNRGRPIDPRLSADMASRFGSQFESVRIHDADQVSESAQPLDAYAYTVGEHIVFARGRYAPETQEGRMLLAHELAHVVQQRRGGPPAEANPHAAAETDATRAAQSVANGGMANITSGTSIGVSRATPPSGLPALTPRELFDRLVLAARGFQFSRGGAPQWDPNLVGKPLGPGYATLAGAQVIDPAGNQVVSSQGFFQQGVHAEVAALRNLAPQSVSIGGGKLVVVVDQLPCAECASALQEFARSRGLSLQVLVPRRAQVTRPWLPASPKTTARTAVQAGRPELEMETVMNVPAPPPSGAAAASTAASSAEATAASEKPVVTAAPAEAATTTEPAAAAAGAAEAEVASAAKPLVSPKVTAGAGIATVGLGVATAVAHTYAVKKIRETEGYAPVGALAYAHESLFSRIGRILTGAVLETQEDLRTRFDLPVWRANVKKRADAVPAGGTLLIIYQAPVQREVFQEVLDLAAVYRKTADGRWELMPEGTKIPEYDPATVLKGLVLPVVSGGKGVITPPDLNLIVGGASDADVGAMLNILPEVKGFSPGYDDGHWA